MFSKQSLSLPLFLLVILIQSLSVLMPSHGLGAECEFLYAKIPRSYSSYSEKISIFEKFIHDYLNELGAPSGGTKSISQKEIGPKLEELLKMIKTPEDLENFWSLAERMSKIKYQKFNTWGAEKYSEETFSTDFIYFLGRTDFVQPIETIKSKLSTKQTRELLTIMDRIAETTPIDLRLDQSSQIEARHLIVLPAQMSLKPDRIHKFIEMISEDAKFARGLGENNPYHSNFGFTLSTASALRSIPEKENLEAKKKIIELLQTPNKPLRRNYEAVHKVLFESEFQQLLTALKSQKSISAKNVDTLMNDYWTKIGLSPSYSFQKVRESAQSIQKGPIGKLIGEDSILLCGSLANGKAKLNTSDIDLIATGNFGKAYEKSFPEGEFPKITPFVDKEAATSLVHDILAEENRVAPILNRGIREPGELLSIHPDIFDPASYMQYNPISVVITKDKFFLRLYDFFGSKNFTDVEITQK
ncbi:MAG: hypothetical protein PHY93_20980 [Bacteriovorax sp.]|nr:hypothetical protein [Bacteriovorax sp.]